MKKICKHKKCWYYPLTGEWYLDTRNPNDPRADYFIDPDCTLFGIRYCPWCGKELSKDGKA